MESMTLIYAQLGIVVLDIHFQYNMLDTIGTKTVIIRTHHFTQQTHSVLP